MTVYYVYMVLTHENHPATTHLVGSFVDENQANASVQSILAGQKPHALRYSPGTISGAYIKAVS